MTYALGEDRSSYQGVAAWTGDEFGFAKATEGVSYVDPAFAANWASLGRAGIVRGAYHFYHPAEDPEAQAEFFVSTVDAHGGFAPGDVFLADVEILTGEDGMEQLLTAVTPRMSLRLLQGPPSAPAVGVTALRFLQEVSRLVGPACPVLLYSDLYMAQNYLGACAGYPLFVAFYEPRPPASVAPWADWTFWQFEQGGGHGGGDADYFNGDLSALLAWRAAYDWTEELVANLPTLQVGSKDVAGQPFYVRRAQVLVAGVGRWNGLGAVTAVKDDGNYGVGTERAVQAVQAHFGLTQDGVVGPETWSALIG